MNESKSGPWLSRLAAGALGAALLAGAVGAAAQSAPAAPTKPAAKPAAKPATKSASAPADKPAARRFGAPSDVVASGPAGAVTRGEMEQLVEQLVPAANRALFWVSPDEVKRFARGLYVQRALAAQARQAGLTPEPASATESPLAREGALVERYMAQSVAAEMPDAQAQEAYARSEYRAQPQRFVEPEQVQVRHILLPVASDGGDDAAVKAEAGRLVEQLRGGADFAALAQARSADPGSARRGGELDWFARGRMVPPFEEAAFALKRPGELSAPVKTPYGYHIIELLGRRPAVQKPFEQVLPDLRREVEAQIDNRVRRRLWEQVENEAQLNEVSIKNMMGDHFTPITPNLAK